MTPFTLEIIAGDAKGRKVAVADKPLVVGRQSDCDIILLNDALVSRKHAQFTVDGSQIFVENLSSLNGVYVNKEKISAKTLLRAGDEIIVGNHQFALHAETVSEIPPPEPIAPPAPSFAIEPQTPAQVAPPAPMPPFGYQMTPPSQGMDAKASALDAQRRLYLFFQLQKASLSSKNSADLLRVVLNLIFQDLRVERGCILVLDPTGQRLDPVCFKVRGKDDLQSQFHPYVDIINFSFSEKKIFALPGNQMNQPGISFAFAIPLIDSERIDGIIYLDTSRPDFQCSKGDFDFLEGLSYLAQTGLSKSKLEESVKQSSLVIERLEKHVGSQVVDLARQAKVEIDRSDLETQEKEVSILFSDIKGFTSMSERLSANEIAFLLNGYFNYMAECVAQHHGYLNKYIGDAVMAVFGAPRSYGNDAVNAIRCAQDMLQKLKLFWATVDESKRFQIRIGINTGIVTAGNIGAQSRMEYTVIGDAVNLASRLESNCPPMGILIGENTYQKVKDQFPIKYLDSIKVKGKEHAVNIYQVIVS